MVYPPRQRRSRNAATRSSSRALKLQNQNVTSSTTTITITICLLGSLCSSVHSYGLSIVRYHNHHQNQNQYYQRRSNPPAFVSTSGRLSTKKSFDRFQTLSSSRSSYFSSVLSMVYAPPGSGYANADDEKSELPDSYEPMMEYPGTMRPGRTPENAPYHDLPLGDEYSERDPVPWPHFNQIEWHHVWDSPHQNPTAMEAFIEQEGRWATPEQEAMMRAGTRRMSLARRDAASKQEAANRKEGLIIDDEDDDDESLIDDLPQELGEGIFGNLGSTDDQKITAAATSPDATKRQSALLDTDSDDLDDDDDDDDEEIDTSDPGLDDFLLDLGLDSFDDEDFDDDEDSEDETVGSAANASRGGISSSSTASGLSQSLDDVVVTAGGGDEGDLMLDDVGDDGMDATEASASIDVDDDDELDLGLDEEDDFTTEESSSDVPLEDIDDNDLFDSNEFFDDGGFDYDDGDYGDSDGFEGFE